MAATALAAVREQESYGITKIVITVPMTIDSTDGATADFTLPKASAIGVQVKGTDFSGKTLAIQAAPDNTNYNALPTAVSFTGNGIASVASADCAFLNYRLLVNGNPGIGLGAAIVVTIIANQQL